MTTSSNHVPIPPRSPTEVTSKAKRRFFTAEYKRRILKEVDECAETGKIGALLRREGLYSSHLVEWRRLRERGALAGLEPKKRGPKRQGDEFAAADKLAEQEREIARLQGPRTRSCS